MVHDEGPITFDAVASPDLLVFNTMVVDDMPGSVTDECHTFTDEPSVDEESTTESDSLPLSPPFHIGTTIVLATPVRESFIELGCTPHN